MLHPQFCRSLEHGGFYFFRCALGGVVPCSNCCPAADYSLKRVKCDRVSIVIAAQFDVSRSHRAKSTPAIAIPKRAFRMMPRTNHKSG